jgi:hypothetical protein
MNYDSFSLQDDALKVTRVFWPKIAYLGPLLLDFLIIFLDILLLYAFLRIFFLNLEIFNLELMSFFSL